LDRIPVEEKTTKNNLMKGAGEAQSGAFVHGDREQRKGKSFKQGNKRPKKVSKAH